MDTIATRELRALGTGVTVAVVDSRELDLATAIVGDVLAAFDKACSRFRPDSDLEQLNAASGRRVPVHGVLLDALGYALWAAAASDGAVDPTIGESLRVLGYDRDFATLDRSQPPALRVERAGGWREVDFDAAAGTVRVPRGIRIDLGATAKALAADRAAALVEQRTGTGVLVSIGGDVAVAGEAPRRGWMVRVTENHADGDDGPGETVAMWTGGLATSTTTVRRWVRGSMPCHHIVDPATGAPARTEWRTVSVAASTCAAANVASTAAIVRGRRAADWLRSLGVPARLVTVAGDVEYLGPWPGPNDTTAA